MNCAFIKQPEPTATIVYCHVPRNVEQAGFGQRFVETYHSHPPQFPHKTIIACNGGQPSKESKALFSSLMDVSFVVRSNDGWDIGAYMAMAHNVTTDFMVCFGGDAYFTRQGWLRRMADVWKKYGPGFYGSCSTFEVRPHINTTGFWTSPAFLKLYPQRVVTKEHRYAFEHSHTSMWRLVHKAGLPVKSCTWENEFDWLAWRVPANCYRRGDQSDCLTGFRHTQVFRDSPPEVKARLTQLADTLTDATFAQEIQAIEALNK